MYFCEFPSLLISHHIYNTYLAIDLHSPSARASVLRILTRAVRMIVEERRYVRPSDRRLAEVATQAAARIDVDALLYRRSEATGVMTERSIDGTAVTATCIIECSLKEMETLLVPPTNDRYASIMRELVGQDFIYGTIVHNANDKVTTQNLSVRTVTFVKRHILARNEQLCFVNAVKPLEPSRQSKDGDGFTVTLASLHPDDVLTGKAQTPYVTHLQGMSALYVVTPEPVGRAKQGRTKRAVRVTFCANVALPSSATRRSPLRWLTMAKHRKETDGASNGVVLARAVQFARSLQQYNTAVRRRRLSAQVFADLRKVQPSNTRCVCCTRRVSLKKSRSGSFKLKKSKVTDAQGPQRCQLCAFLVCARCVCTVGKGSISSESLGLSSKSDVSNQQPIYLCEHCMLRVDDADYDRFSVWDGSSSQASTIQPDSPDADPPSAVIARKLSQVLATASKDEKPVIVRVIKHLLSPNQEKNSTFRANSAELTKSLGRLAKEQGFANEIDMPNVNPEVTPEGPVTPTDDERPVLADSSGREYALQYTDLQDYQVKHLDDTDDSEDTEDAQDTENDESVSFVSRFPVPPDENERLRWLKLHPNIISRVMDLPDLELLCNIALAELQCDAVAITIFDADKCYVVASTDPVWQHFELPRPQAICSYTLMTGKPLLLNYPEADVRFAAIDLVRQNGLRFYFGFPVQVTRPGSKSSTTVGTFCCVQMNKSRDVSESQYALMAILVQGVNRVLEFQASKLLEGQSTMNGVQR